MGPRTILITGCNRGLGLGMVSELLATEVEQIFATCRDPSKAKELNDIKDSRLHVIEMDVQDNESILAAREKIEKMVGDKGLNLLINNAGVLTPYPYRDGESPDRKTFNHMLDVNVVSVVAVTQIMLPLLRKSASKNAEYQMGPSRAAIVNITSWLASNQLNDNGSWLINIMAYRASKAALNQVTTTMAVDLTAEGILCAGFDPGWVKTDMGGPRANFTTKECMEKLIPSILSLNEKDNGGYFSNEKIPHPY